MEPIAEVIASQTRMFTAQLLRDQTPPALGTWIKVERTDGILIWGVVYSIESASIEPSRQVEAFGKPREALMREMPQVFELIRTYVSVLILGYETPDGQIRQTLPPHPPELHDFVTRISDADVMRMQQPFDFLRTLMQSKDNGLPLDDLLVAMLRQYETYAPTPDLARRYLLAAGRQLSRLMGDDHERLQSILRRASA